MIPNQPQQPNPNSSNTSNIVKRLFNKYNDLDEQKFSERIQIALKIMHILFKTDQCKEQEYLEVKNLVLYTKDNIDTTIYSLDMMIDPNDRLPYDQSKWHKKAFNRYLDKNRKQSEKKYYYMSDIQELLFITVFQIDKIVIDNLLENDLLDYWE